MEIQEALNTLAQVVEQYFTGLPKDQRVVQQAIQVLVKAIEPTTSEVEKPKPKKERTRRQ